DRDLEPGKPGVRSLDAERRQRKAAAAAPHDYAEPANQRTGMAAGTDTADRRPVRADVGHRSFRSGSVALGQARATNVRSWPCKSRRIISTRSAGKRLAASPTFSPLP